MKIVNEERIAIIVELERVEGEIEITAQAQYQVTAEDLVENRSLPVTLNKGHCLALAKEALKQIKDKEE